MNQTDAQIVRQVVLGNREAFGILVDRYHGRCLRVASHLLNDPDDAEDAVQEAFVRAYRHLGSYRERDRFGAWLLRIVVNQCRSRASYDRRWTSFDSANEPRIEHRSIDDEQRAELAHAMMQLAPEQREAITLRFAEELSFAEMASVTGVGISALKMRVQRACTRLRTLLSEQINA